MPRETESHRTQAPKPAPRKEKQLDEALEETFPSSDPVSVSVSPKENEWTPEELAEAERKKRQKPEGRS
jgi:hypothetical protein